MKSKRRVVEVIDLAFAEEQPVVRLEVAAVFEETFGRDVAAVGAALVEGQAVAEDARLAEPLLQLEFELDPGQFAVVQHLDAHMQEAVGVEAGIVERRIGRTVRMTIVTGVAELISSRMTIGSSLVPVPETPAIRKPPSSSEKL